MFLNELKAGERAVVRSVGGEGALRQHFLDMGTVFSMSGLTSSFSASLTGP